MILLIVIIGASIFIEDWNTRLISLWKLLALMLLIIIDQILTKSLNTIFTQFLINTINILLIYISLLAYTFVKYNNQSIFSTIGSGDIILLLICGIGIPADIFAYFIPLIATISCISHFALWGKASIRKTVPFASYIILCYSLLYANYNHIV
jgi:hypothetical protein